MERKTMPKEHPTIVRAKKEFSARDKHRKELRRLKDSVPDWLLNHVDRPIRSDIEHLTKVREKKHRFLWFGTKYVDKYSTQVERAYYCPEHPDVKLKENTFMEPSEDHVTDYLILHDGCGYVYWYDQGSWRTPIGVTQWG